MPEFCLESISLAFLSSFLISLAGIVPILFLPANADEYLQTKDFNVWSSWVLIGIVSFYAIEKFALISGESPSIVSTYLNLIANTLDNFTHGLTIGGSYLISVKFGLLTTLSILLHEIPHEMGDFGLLLKNGLTKWQATKAQAGLLIHIYTLITIFVNVNPFNACSGKPPMSVSSFGDKLQSLATCTINQKTQFSIFA
ncbi:hypothetical protein Ciccas_004135 [Cichlidogyrus casuarinus]|uniref:Zinc transporter ZIP13 n=1 Tax=Cichlidogyrus casuarinus TaxID=1844966 RepID=A0ABD2QCG1_9PLAT